MKTPLNASELANLWSTYMSNSMAVHTIPYYLKQCRDAEVHSLVDFAFQISKKILQNCAEILKQENCPLPAGFSEMDLNLNAPRLYTDNFALTHFQSMSEYGLVFYGLALATATRSDVRSFFDECISLTVRLYNKSTELLDARGLANAAPAIPVPDQVDFVHRQGFLTGWFGDRRPLNAIEINQLVFNYKGTAFGGAKIMSYSQTAKSKEVREFFIRGKEICEKHLQVFGSLLREDNLPVPKTYVSEVTDSTEAPFSDKIMMFMILALGSVVIGRYGTAMGLISRRDVCVHFSRLLAETGEYLEDGAKIMIKHGWMEQPPQALDRKSLAKR